MLVAIVPYLGIAGKNNKSCAKSSLAMFTDY
jgi:hypothetical protein